MVTDGQQYLNMVYSFAVESLKGGSTSRVLYWKLAAIPNYTLAFVDIK